MGVDAASPLCRVAFVGAGLMAREHLRAFGDVPGVTLVGIHSRTRERAETLANEFSVPVVADSVEELYERSEADLVVVAVPELSTNAVSKTCFRFPWTVLLEKPAGYNLRDAEDISTAAAGRQVFVAMNRRFYSSTRTALEDVQTHDAPRFVLIQDQEDPQAGLASGKPEVVVENWMYANAIHLVDFARIFCRGAVARVTPVVPWAGLGSAQVVAHIEFDSGDRALYQGTWDGPGPWTVSLSTSQRRWELRPIEQASFQDRGERRLRAVEPDPIDAQFKPGFRRQAAAVVAAAQGLPNDAVPLADALETMRLISAIFGRD